MSKFNSVNKKGRNKTVNLAGGEAFKMNPELELASTLLTTFVEDKFYKSGSDTVKQVKSLINTIKDKTFPAKAAIYARDNFGMRSISHVVAGEIVNLVKGEEWVKDFINKVVVRADDMTEIMSYHFNKHNKTVPNNLKKGLRKAFGKFDEYQLAKYKASDKDVSLVDLANLIHPKPTAKNRVALKKLVEGTLKSTGTWEAELSKAGTQSNKKAAKAEAWEELVNTKKIGYMALLRNLRNIIQDAPNAIDAACELLKQPNLIRKSRVLPFRFTTAYDELKGIKASRKVLAALSEATDISLSNVPPLNGKTLVVIDDSGSMEGMYGHSVKPIEIAALFGAVLYKATDSDLMMFNSNARYHNPDPTSSVLSIRDSIRSMCQCGGTNFHSIFEKASKAYDRVVILSDMQGWVGYNAPTSTFEAYCRKYKAKPHIYSFDLQGYGSLQFPQDRVYCMAGWSEKIFDIMEMLELDRNALVNEIKKVSFI